MAMPSSPSTALTASAQLEAAPDMPDDLEELALRKVAHLIRSGKAQKIVVLTGAGISTSAGIPDFRSPQTGLYANLAKLKLPDPQAVFDIDYFRRRPEPFWTLAKDLYPGKYLPTPTHHFLSLLSTPRPPRPPRPSPPSSSSSPPTPSASSSTSYSAPRPKPLLLRLFSQNIDTLESLAGVPAERIVEAHGSFGGARCIDCGVAYGREYVLGEGVRDGKVVRCRGTRSGSGGNDEEDGDGDGGGGGKAGGIGRDEQGASKGGTSKSKAGKHNKSGSRGSSGNMRLSKREHGCGGLVKPDIVFFGEGLPERFFERMSDMRQADLVLIIGTSLQVGPFCNLPQLAPAGCPKALINREAVGEFVGTERRQRRYFEQVRKKRRTGVKNEVRAQSGKKAEMRDTAEVRGTQEDEVEVAEAAKTFGSLGLSDPDPDAVADAEQPTATTTSKAKPGQTAHRSSLCTDADDQTDPDPEYTSPDLFYKGDADAAIYRLADMLGWRDELEEKVKEVNGRLDREWGL